MGVLLVTSTAVLFLFEEARAVDIQVTSPSGLTTQTTNAAFTVSVQVPNNQLLPIHALRAVVEQTTGATKTSPVVVATGACTGATGCSSPVTTGSHPTAVKAIQGAVGNPAQSFGYLSIDTAGNTFDAAYGYGKAGASRVNVIASDQQTTGYGYGYGYGYGGATGGTLTYTISIDPSALGAGHFWLTFLVDTGSTTIGTISSTATHFEVATPASSGGGGSTPPTVPGVPTPPTPVPSPGGHVEVTPPTTHALNADGHAVVTANLNTTHVPSGGALVIHLDGVGASLNVTGLHLGSLGATFGDATTPQFTFSASPDPLPGSPGLPPAFTPLLYMDFALTAPSSSFSAGTFTFSLTSADFPGLSSMRQVALIHFNHTSGQWEFQPTVPTFDGGTVSYLATLPSSFSPFAIAADSQPPTIGTLHPLDAATSGPRPVIGASVSDNRGIDATRTTLDLDGHTVAATITDTSVLYTPDTALLAGTHTVKLHLVDVSGLDASRTWSFTSAATPSAQPTVVIGAPANGTFLNEKRPTIRATLADADGDLDLATLTLRVDGSAVTPSVATGVVTYAPAADLQDGAHTVELTVADAAGNGAFAAWTFTVDTVAPRIADLTPAEGASASADAPISASVSDTLSGIASATMTLDGAPVTSTLTQGVATHTPAQPLAPGTHTASLTATDKAGNTDTKTWSFQTASTSETPGATTGATSSGSGWIIGLVVVALIVIAGVAAFLTRRRK